LSNTRSDTLAIPHGINGFPPRLEGLELLSTAPGPGICVELPFTWPESPAQARNASRDLPPPPIVELLKSKRGCRMTAPDLL
jgi:hypothetical protein